MKTENTTYILNKCKERQLEQVSAEERRKACTSHMNELAKLSKRELVKKSKKISDKKKNCINF